MYVSLLHSSRLHLNNDSDADCYLDDSDDTDQQLLDLKKSLPSPETNVYEVPISIRKEYKCSKIGKDDEHYYESI